MSVLLHAALLALMLAAPWVVLEPEQPQEKRTSSRAVVLAPAPLRITRPLRATARTPLLPEPAPAVRPVFTAPAQAAAPVKTRVVEAVTLAVDPAAPKLAIVAPELPAAPPKLPVVTGTFESTPAKVAVAVKPQVAMAGLDAAPAAANTRLRAVATMAAGFGDAAPAAAQSARVVSRGGFETATAAAPVAQRAAVVQDAGFVPVEILDKPRPLYTEEARRMRVEGSVAVRVIFGATGEIRILGVVRGLGHGLDEAATEAASRIRFKPARRAGQPVDAPAVVQIVFQLA